MYTEPTIVNADRLKCKSYVTFYLNGVRHRVVSGRPLGLRIFPNRAKTVESRRKGLEWLRAEILKRLAADTFPLQPEVSSDPEVQLILSAVNQLTTETKQANALNAQRLAKLEQIHDLLADYLISHEVTPDQ